MLKKILSILNGCKWWPSSDAQIMVLLEQTNLNGKEWPWNQSGSKLADRLIIKRWSPPIPVQTNGILRAAKALDRVEARLGVTMFDRDVIANTPETEVRRGIIFVEGSAVSAPPGVGAFGNVAWARGGTAYPDRLLAQTGEIDTKLYINLGAPGYDDTTCGKEESDIAVHELGHALGLGPHFKGFGNRRNGIISERFWKVLKVLYSNPIGTAQHDIKINC